MKKKVQFNKDQKKFDNAELRQASYIKKEQSKVSHSTGDIEENWLLTHLKNRYTNRREFLRESHIRGPFQPDSWKQTQTGA